jgi:transposase-like protein
VVVSGEPGRSYRVRPDVLRQTLEERWPSRVLPRGAVRQLAREFGVSHQGILPRVRALGWQPSRTGPLPTRYACVCGAARKSPTLCPECRLIRLECSGCGTEFQRRASEIRWRVGYNDTRAAKGLPLYSGRVFCSRRCFHDWLGPNLVNLRRQPRRPPDEALARRQAMRTLLEERYPSGALPYGAVSELARELGISPRHARRLARELGAAAPGDTQV